MTVRGATTLPVAATLTPLRAGQPLVWRLFARERLFCVRTGVVVAHDELGLRLCFTPGNPGLDLRTPDGRSIRDMPFAEWIRQPSDLTPVEWLGSDALLYVRPGAAHSVWWFFKGAFTDWYVNLEEPAVVWHDGELAGVDTTDQDLDIVVRGDRTWAWKDEDEFTERLGHPQDYWVADEAAVRAEGERALRALRAREFPFDGTWCDWAPDPAWRHPTIVPAGALRPRVHYGG